MRRTTEGAKSLEHAIRTTRLRWFTGRFITARDLTDEQEYHLDRHRLHNRLLHGWGTVCGLGVHPHDRADCAHEWVWVDAASPSTVTDARSSCRDGRPCGGRSTRRAPRARTRSRSSASATTSARPSHCLPSSVTARTAR